MTSFRTKILINIVKKRLALTKFSVRFSSFWCENVIKLVRERYFVPDLFGAKTGQAALLSIWKFHLGTENWKLKVSLSLPDLSPIFHLSSEQQKMHSMSHWTPCQRSWECPWYQFQHSPQSGSHLADQTLNNPSTKYFIK